KYKTHINFIEDISEIEKDILSGQLIYVDDNDDTPKIELQIDVEACRGGYWIDIKEVYIVDNEICSLVEVREPPGASIDAIVTISDKAVINAHDFPIGLAAKIFHFRR
nr:hypothetical protein [Candidatus Cloacimonadota bacterium]